MTATPPPSGLDCDTPRGPFTLRAVDPDVDLALVHRWMNAPHVVPFWRQAWTPDVTARYLADQLAGDVSRPSVGLLAGEPVSYWEIYRPIAEPVGAAYPAKPDDLGVHVLIGEAAMTGKGLGTLLLSVVRDALFAAAPQCRQIVAEPDFDNHASLRAFSNAGFTASGQVALPGKTAMLMIARREEVR